MTQTLTYTVHLTSDAHPGTGLGSQSIQGYLQRGADGRPEIGGDHMLGLVRDALAESLLAELPSAHFGWIDRLLGRADADGAAHRDAEGRVRFEPLRIEGGCSKGDGSLSDSVRLVSQTAIDEDAGTASNGALRSKERLAVGTQLAGTVWFNQSLTETDRKLLTMGLLNIRGLGGSRQRGVGECVVEIESSSSGSTNTPGSLWKGLYSDLQQEPVDEASAHSGESTSSADSFADAQSSELAWFDLAFTATSPVLVPEFPATQNIIKSGIAIPASAVMGVLLWAAQDHGPAGLADALAGSESFRAGPLLPACHSVEDKNNDSFTPTLISLTHKVAKVFGKEIASDDFADEAIAPYKMEDRPSGSPLKSANGVLLQASVNAEKGGGSVKLWRGSDIPRRVRTHGVHNNSDRSDRRGLWTADALLPMTFRGRLCGPKELIEKLKTTIEKNDGRCSFGKRRKTYGHGTLTVTDGSAPAIPKNTAVFILQSPARLDDDAPHGDADEALKALSKAWAKEHGLGEVDQAWATPQLQFGFGGNDGTGKRGRQRAVRVIAAGSVIRLKAMPDAEKVSQACAKGLGSDRLRGFGAIAPHPGTATTLYKPQGEMATLTTPAEESKNIKNGFDLAGKIGGNLSISRLWSLVRKYAVGLEVGNQFLESRTKMDGRTQQSWKSVNDAITQWEKDTSKLSAQRIHDTLLVCIDAYGDQDA